MAQQSQYLHLTLPELTEYYLLSVTNGNLQIIDAFAGTVNTHMVSHANPHQVTAQQVGAPTNADFAVLEARVAALESAANGGAE